MQIIVSYLVVRFSSLAFSSLCVRLSCPMTAASLSCAAASRWVCPRRVSPLMRCSPSRLALCVSRPLRSVIRLSRGGVPVVLSVGWLVSNSSVTRSPSSLMVVALSFSLSSRSASTRSTIASVRSSRVDSRCSRLSTFVSVCVRLSVATFF